MNNSKMLKILLSFLLCCLVKGLTSAEMCTVLKEQNDVKTMNISNPLHRYITFRISNDKKECWLDTHEVYMETSFDQEIDQTIALKFVCMNSEAQVHIQQNSSYITERQKPNIVLIMQKCAVLMDDINVLRDFGKIIMIQIYMNDKIFEPSTKCDYASDLKMFQLANGCDRENSTRKLFWEACNQTFSKTIILSLELCIDINTTALKDRFPNLHTLTLWHVSLQEKLQFPWNHNDTVDKARSKESTSIMKIYFDFLQKSERYYMFSENSLTLFNCQIQQKSLHFSGAIDEVRLVKLGFSDLDSNIFHNVVISTTLDLSENCLKTLNDDLFDNQNRLKYLFLQNNQLTVLSKNVFKSLQSILAIDLSNNLIRTINVDPFQSLTHLKEINLNNNSIVKLPEDMFKDQTESITTLQLNSNPLIDIPVWPFYATRLQIYDIRNANLTGKNIIKLLDGYNRLNVIEQEVETQLSKSFKVWSGEKTILLQGNNIETIPSANITYLLLRKFLMLVMYFKFNFDENPLTCNCDTYVIETIVYSASNTDQTGFSSSSLQTFICQYPLELRGKPMWSISEDEKYCPENLNNCPLHCRCFKRFDNETVIVDCRNITFGKMPSKLPVSKKLELWFENCNISTLTPEPYLENVTVLNLARNHLRSISAFVVNKLQKAREIYLNSNKLTTLPIQMQALHFSKLTLSDNFFVCDCSTRWMKRWMFTFEDKVPDWASVQCLLNSSNITQLVAVPDSKFVCRKPGINITEHIFLPLVINGSVLFVILILSLLSYVYRFNIKVILFIYFNIHPFDNNQQEECCLYDAVLIYAMENKEPVQLIADHLKRNGCKLGDLYKDSIAGFTWLENVERFIYNSRRVIFYIQDMSENNKVMQAAWNIAYNKFVMSAFDCIILITDKKTKTQKNLDDSLRLFMRSNSCIDKHNRLLLEKISYLMPFQKSEKKLRKKSENLTEHCTNTSNKNIIVSYPDDFHHDVKEKLHLLLSQHNFRVKDFDLVFTYGCDKREELPAILETTHFVIFILNNETLKDEVKMYILSEIITKAVLENHNYLLLCTSDQISMLQLTKDQSHYVENYVTLQTSDPKFQERILQSLTPSQYVLSALDIAESESEMLQLL